MKRPLLLCLILIMELHKNGEIVKKKTKGTAKRVKCLQIDSLQAPWGLFKATILETQRKCMTTIKKSPEKEQKEKVTAEQWDEGGCWKEEAEIASKHGKQKI